MKIVIVNGSAKKGNTLAAIGIVGKVCYVVHKVWRFSKRYHNKNLSNFFEKFLDSKISKQFERGESSVIVGKSGIELSLEILNNSKLASKYRPVANKSPEYWCGWAFGSGHIDYLWKRMIKYSFAYCI